MSFIKLEGWVEIGSLIYTTKTESGKWRMTDGGEKKLKMTECGRKNDEWKNVNDNARIMKS